MTNLVIVRQAVVVRDRSGTAAIAVASVSAWRSLIDSSYLRRAGDSSISPPAHSSVCRSR